MLDDKKDKKKVTDANQELVNRTLQNTATKNEIEELADYLKKIGIKIS